jgi:hypothetical protein
MNRAGKKLHCLAALLDSFVGTACVRKKLPQTIMSMSITRSKTYRFAALDFRFRVLALLEQVEAQIIVTRLKLRVRLDCQTAFRDGLIQMT